MAIGSVHQLIYLPGQIVYRYTAIQQIAVTAKEFEKNVMEIFKANPGLVPQKGHYRLLGNAVAVLSQGRVFYYKALNGQSMAITVPGAGQTLSMAPSDRVSLSAAANVQAGRKVSAMALKSSGGV